MDRRNAARRYGQTVYLPELKGSRAVPLRRRRLEARSGVGGYDENWLQRLLFETPEVLPIGEIDPVFAPAVPLCRELPTTAGSIDVAYVSEQGLLSILECKLWRNPEARRDAVSQILDYAKEISRGLSQAICRHSVHVRTRGAGYLRHAGRIGGWDHRGTEGARQDVRD